MLVNFLFFLNILQTFDSISSVKLFFLSNSPATKLSMNLILSTLLLVISFELIENSMTW